METRLFSLYYLKSWFSQASVLEAGAENFCWENNVKPLNFEAGRIGTENQFRFTEIQASLNSCCPSLNLVLHSSNIYGVSLTKFKPEDLRLLKNY